MDHQAYLTDPLRRPRSSHKVVATTPAMEHQEFLLLKHAVLLSAVMAQHVSNPMAVGCAIEEQIHMPPHLLRITNHDPEDFLVHLELPTHKENTVRRSVIKVDDVDFAMTGWHEDDHEVPDDCTLHVQAPAAAKDRPQQKRQRSRTPTNWHHSLSCLGREAAICISPPCLCIAHPPHPLLHPLANYSPDPVADFFSGNENQLPPPPRVEPGREELEEAIAGALAALLDFVGDAALRPSQVAAASAPIRHSAWQVANPSSTPIMQRALLRLVQELGVLGPKERMTVKAAEALLRRFDEPLTEDDVSCIAKLTRLDIQVLRTMAGLVGANGVGQE
ncbi:hypothetical protein VPH35_112996 [Triticum aestivum]